MADLSLCRWYEAVAEMFYLTYYEVTLPHKMYDDDPDLLSSRHMSNCASYSQLNVLQFYLKYTENNTAVSF